MDVRVNSELSEFIMIQIVLISAAEEREKIRESCDHCTLSISRFKIKNPFQLDFNPNAGAACVFAASMFAKARRSRALQNIFSPGKLFGRLRRLESLVNLKRPRELLDQRERERELLEASKQIGKHLARVQAARMAEKVPSKTVRKKMVIKGR